MGNDFENRDSLNKTGKGSGKAGKIFGKKTAKTKSKSLRSGLFFPVGRIHRFLKKKTNNISRVGTTSAIFLAAILEYLTAEIL